MEQRILWRFPLEIHHSWPSPQGTNYSLTMWILSCGSLHPTALDSRMPLPSLPLCTAAHRRTVPGNASTTPYSPPPLQICTFFGILPKDCCSTRRISSLDRFSFFSPNPHPTKLPSTDEFTHNQRPHKTTRLIQWYSSSRQRRSVAPTLGHPISHILCESHILFSYPTPFFQAQTYPQSAETTPL